MSGLVTMSRNWQDHDIFEGDEFSRRDAWAWLISQAAWKPTTARVKGAKVELARGELCFSQRFMAAKWGWSKSRVDRFIATLRDEGMIETRSKIGANADHAAGQGQSILTICNYDKYQLTPKGERGNVEPASGATAGQQRGKEEEGNKKPTVSPRAIPLPDDWKPEPFGDGAQCRAIVDAWDSGELARQVEAFTAYHRANATKSKDWHSSWQTWVLNSVKFGRRIAAPLSDNRLPGEPIPMWKHLKQERESSERRTATAGGRG